jgi:RNA-splicing ligase RtcB
MEIIEGARVPIYSWAADVYKDIESVMALSTDLVRPVTRLRPLGVVKG